MGADGANTAVKICIDPNAARESSTFSSYLWCFSSSLISSSISSSPSRYKFGGQGLRERKKGLFIPDEDPAVNDPPGKDKLGDLTPGHIAPMSIDVDRVDPGLALHILLQFANYGMV